MADLKEALENLDIAEAYGLAIKVEEDGFAFYDKASQLAEDKKTKEDLAFLRDQEKGHKLYFEKLLKETGKDYKEDTSSALHAWVNKQLVEPVKKALEQNPPKTSDEAVQIGIRLETNSVLLYKSIRKATDSKDIKKAIKKIIREEQSHREFLKAILKYSSLREIIMDGLES